MQPDELAREMREGLDGVTPGPWDACHRPHEGKYSGWSVETKNTHPNAGKGGYARAWMPILANSDPDCNPVTDPERDIRHVARCSPDNIRALLDDRDRLIAERDEARAATANILRNLNEAEAALSTSQAEVVKLREALKSILFQRAAGPIPKLVPGHLIEDMENIARASLSRLEQDGK